MKKHNLRCNYCGNDNYTLKFFLMLKLIIKDTIYVECPFCGNVSSYVLVSHIVHDTVDLREKELNKMLFENKKQLWGNS